MPLESATYISQLNTSNPAHTDGLNQADSHLRLIKSVLQAQFPNFGAAAVVSTNTNLDASVAALTTGPIKAPSDGTVGAPAFSFVSDATSGLYRAGAGDYRVSILGADTLQLQSGAITVSGTGTLNLAGGSTKLLAGGVAVFPLQSANIGSQQVTSAAIANNTITNTQIANNTIGATQITNGAIGTTQLASGAVAIGNIAADTGNKGKAIGYDPSTGSATQLSLSFGTNLLHVREEQTSGTAGTSVMTASAFSKRTLNTTKTNEIASATLVSNQISLPAGTYYCDGLCHGTGGAFNTSLILKARLRDVTNNVTLVVGTSQTQANPALGSDAYGTNNTLLVTATGRFTLAGTVTIEFQNYQVGGVSAGAAVSSGEVEIYADLRIWKIA
jgi:hypothetical protein